MNGLERAVEHDLAATPEPPPVGMIERRARRRRAREVAGGLASAVVVGALAVGGFVWTRPSAPVDVRTTSPATSTSTSTVPPTTARPTLPLATTATFPGLADVLRQVHDYELGDGPVASGEIVATTTDKTFVLFGGQPGRRPIYLVKLVGHFVCNGCSVPPGRSAPHGDEIMFTVARHAPPPLDAAFSIGSQDVDLSVFGKVYRLPGYPG